MLDAIGAAIDTAADPSAVKLTSTEPGRETATGRRLTPETLEHLAASDAFTPADLNRLTDPDTSRRAPARYLYETPGESPGEASGVWHEEHPILWRFSAEEPPAFTAVSPERIAKSVDTAWAENRDALAHLWSGPVSMFADAQRFAERVAANSPDAPALGPAKQAALRDALGLRESAGPTTAAADAATAATPAAQPEAPFTTRQLDQTHRLNTPEPRDLGLSSEIRPKTRSVQFSAGADKNQPVQNPRQSHDTDASAETRSTAPKKILSRGELYSAHVDPNGGGIFAELKNDGLIEFCIQRGPSTPRGAEMFREMLDAYGPNLAGIRGVWLGYGELRDNFDSFHAAIGKGLSPEQAAFETFTGKMAYRAGFAKVSVVKIEKEKVIVEFTK